MKFIQRVWRRWLDQHPEITAAGLAFFGLLSVSPFFYLLTRLAAFGLEASGGAVQKSFLARLMGNSAARSLQHFLQTDGEGAAVADATAWLSVVFTVLAASWVFLYLEKTINRCMNRTPPQQNVFTRFIWHRLRAMVLVLASGALLWIGMIAETLLSVMVSHVPWMEALVHWQGISRLITISVTFLFFLLVLKGVPAGHVAWRAAAAGAGVGTVLFTMVRYLLGFYFRFFADVSASSVASGFFAFLVWLYASVAIFLLAVSVSAVYQDELEPK